MSQLRCLCGRVSLSRVTLLVALLVSQRAVCAEDRAAWNFRDAKLTRVWTFDSDDGTPGNREYRGQGNHNLSIADVDADGKDEIVCGACVIDHDGKGLYTTGLGHGDAMHLSDIDPRYKGYECWANSSDGLYTCKGERISEVKPRSCNMGVWWDGDLLREILDGTTIDKWDYAGGTTVRLLSADGCSRNNGPNPILVSTPTFWAIGRRK